jgi:hypothetical protein
MLKINWSMFNPAPDPGPRIPDPGSRPLVSDVSNWRSAIRPVSERGSCSAGAGTALQVINDVETPMRFMILIKANRDSEAGVLPDQKLLAEMGKFNEELVKAGVMLDGEGLQPSSKGARVTFSGTKRTVIDGPFPETKELIAGYWIWKVKSKEEAIEWVKRCPNPMPDTESEIEIRQIFESEDFGAEFTPELRAQEDRVRAQIEKQKQ